MNFLESIAFEIASTKAELDMLNERRSILMKKLRELNKSLKAMNELNTQSYLFNEQIGDPYD